MQCFAQATPASEVREMPGVLIANAGVDTPVFNTAFLTSPPQDLVDLDRRIAIAKVYYEARGLHWSCAGMLAEQIPAASREAPPIECRRVSDAETRMAFCHITSACFGIPFETSLAIYNSAKTWQTDFIAYTAYLEGQPVATAATCLPAARHRRGPVPSRHRRSAARGWYAAERAAGHPPRPGAVPAYGLPPRYPDHGIRIRLKP